MLEQDYYVAIPSLVVRTLLAVELATRPVPRCCRDIVVVACYTWAPLGQVGNIEEPID